MAKIDTKSLVQSLIDASKAESSGVAEKFEKDLEPYRGIGEPVAESCKKYLDSVSGTVTQQLADSVFHKFDELKGPLDASMRAAIPTDLATRLSQQITGQLPVSEVCKAMSGLAIEGGFGMLSGTLEEHRNSFLGMNFGKTAMDEIVENVSRISAGSENLIKLPQPLIDCDFISADVQRERNAWKRHEENQEGLQEVVNQLRDQVAELKEDRRVREERYESELKKAEARDKASKRQYWAMAVLAVLGIVVPPAFEFAMAMLSK
ncbi:MAG: hypothetical protein KF812_09515 [Fimbriimonadaceae bacterium]|nr:hypothetical protein [Fimbriimonadaceae bacterium]